MKVHMVTHWVTKQKLVRPWSRYVHYLCSYLGWSANCELDKGADVNYILTSSVGWRRHIDPWKTWKEWGGPLACGFGVRPPYGLKARLWDEGVENADLRLVLSRRCVAELEQYGPTEAVKFFIVDHDLFSIAKRRDHTKPVIGVAGYKVRTGRKGSEMVGELAGYPGMPWRIRAAGNGWPVKTKNYSYCELPLFYQHLDVYLNTATVRDTSSGIFQAAACGIPLVIPRDLPVTEDWPPTHGVYYYERGNFDSMYETIGKCVSELGSHDREGLRGLTKELTAQRFCEEHAHVFREYFADKL